MHSPPGIYDLPTFTPSGVANYFDTTGRRYDSPQVYFSTCVELMRIMKEQLLHAHMKSLWVVGAEGDPYTF